MCERVLRMTEEPKKSSPPSTPPPLSSPPAPTDAVLSAREHAQALFDRLRKQIPALPERAMRREVVGEMLCALESPVQTELLRLICLHGSSSSKNQLLLLALQDQPQANHQLTYEQTREIYETARAKGYHNVQRLFLSYTPIRTADAPPPGHHQLSGLSLGERKFLARKRDIYTLEKLLLDPEPSVIRNLLRNPRITEKEVLYITTRRPNTPEILQEVVNQPRWFKRYRIKVAICSNPYTPLSLSLRALPFLSSADLLSIAESPNLHPQLISAAEEILRIRQAPLTD